MNWQEVCDHPQLQNLPFKIELNAWGNIVMSPAKSNHSVLQWRIQRCIYENLIGELHRQLKGKPCRVYPSDLRVRVSPTGLYTYPNVVVACDEPRFADDHRDTLLNPTGRRVSIGNTATLNSTTAPGPGPLRDTSSTRTFDGRPTVLQTTVLLPQPGGSLVQSTIDIDDSLVRKAMELAQIRDPEELIKLALTELIERCHQERLFGLVGKVQFRDDFDHKADRVLKRVPD